MHACPVAIDTGKLIKAFRAEDHGPRAERLGLLAARRYGAVERLARLGAPLARGWRRSVPPAAPARLPATDRAGAAAVYMPACINRIFGNPRGAGARPTLPEALVAVSSRAGLPVWIPEDVAGHCCGTPWSSKGYRAGHEYMTERIGEAVKRWTEGGRLPLVVDASSCSHGLVSEAGIEVLDSIAWVHDHLLPSLHLRRKLEAVAVHPTCSSTHLGLSGKLAAIAAKISDEVVVPAASGCCGMAGDRGWFHPELPRSALRDVARELDGRSFDACLSSNRTCEVALHEVTGRSYSSFVLALEELTRG
jgi:D-lactate dehydrogenase